MTASANPLRTQPSADARARSIVEALSDPAIVLDDAANVLALNAAALEALGSVRPGQQIGRSAGERALLGAIKTCLDTGHKTAFEFLESGPSPRQLDGTAARLDGFERGSGLPYLLVVLKDISEREALTRMRMEFVANASHELRTPLAALSGFIETLKGPARDDSAARDRFLAIMAEQAHRMSRLIDDLLLLSRIEMRAHLHPTATADLAHVAAEAIKIVGPAAAVEKTRITADLGDRPATIAGDHDELIQAVLNLISNAVKYGRRAGNVAVSLRECDDKRIGPAFELSISDDGPGIAPEHLPRLTERFYRVSTTASREKGGTGLGLAIVKHIAARHRGRIEVASSLGKGSTFSLVLPRRPTV